jgi:hypothetical protein
MCRMREQLSVSIKLLVHHRPGMLATVVPLYTNAYIAPTNTAARMLTFAIAAVEVC